MYLKFSYLWGKNKKKGLMNITFSMNSQFALQKGNRSVVTKPQTRNQADMIHGKLKKNMFNID